MATPTPEEQAEADRVKALARATRELKEIEEERREGFEDLNEELDSNLKLERARLREMALAEAPNETAIKDQREKIKLMKEENALKKESLKIGEAVATDLLGAIGLNKKFEDSMASAVITTLANDDANKAFSKTLLKGISIQNVAYSMLLKVKQATFALAISQDEALVSLNKQTGAAKLYGNELIALESELFKNGVTSEEASESYVALAKNVYNLRNISSGARKDLATTTALLQEMGVSADTTGANVQFMTASLGMSVSAASEYQRELFTLAREIGMPPAEMAEGFKSAQPKLAAFGKQAGKVFKDLAVNARAAGMEVEQILGIVEQFDTFEGAATAVGKLNAILGGSFLNSMEMVTETDPTQRMRMLSQALNDAGKSFDQMSYYERKSIAAAAGLSDVNELALVMAGNFNGVAGGAGKSQAEIERMAKEAAEFQSIQDELNQVVRLFAIEMRPVVKFLKEFLQGTQELGTSVKMLVPILTGLLTAGAAAKIGLDLVKAGLLDADKAFRGAGLIGLFVTMLTVFTMLDGPTRTLVAALAALTIGLYLLSGSFVTLQASTGGIIFLITTLVSAIVYLISTLFQDDVGASTFLEGIWKIAHGFVDIGVGILQAAAGFYAIIPAVFALLALTPALAMSVLPGGAFWTLSTGLGWVADALERLDEGTIERMTALFEAFASISAEAAKSIDQVGESFLKLGAGLMMASTAMLNPMLAPVVMTAVASGALVGTAAAVGSNTLVSDSPEGVSAKGAGSTKKSPPQDHTITLKFDDRGFEKRVIKIINDQLNLNQG